MNISELIEELDSIRDTFGDLPVTIMFAETDSDEVENVTAMDYQGNAISQSGLAPSEVVIS
jgi:hypothetical protein